MVLSGHPSSLDRSPFQVHDENEFRLLLSISLWSAEAAASATSVSHPRLTHHLGTVQVQHVFPQRTLSELWGT